MKRLVFLILIYISSFILYAQKVEKVITLTDKVELILNDNNIISIIPFSDNTVRIKSRNREINIELPEFVFINKCIIPKFIIKESENSVLIKLKKINIIVNKQTGTFTFTDSNGNIFLQEKENSRIIKQNKIDEEICYFVEQSFLTSKDEYIFGLGQFQDGHYNIKDITRRLIQVNTQISLPFIFSSNGYGLIWHQYGLTDFNPADNYIDLYLQEKSSNSEQFAEVTTTSGTQKILQNQSLYTGKFFIPEDGEYIIFLDLGDMGNRHFVAIDDEIIINQSNFWLPPSVSSILKLKAGEHRVEVICKTDNKPKLSWRSIDNFIKFRSPHSSGLDYVVIYGPSADSVISTFHRISGKVPMLPLWAYGFWQCRERYTSARQLIETVKEFRERKLPMDVIVQDWQYWGENGWGVPKFDEKHYPDPSFFIKNLHDLNAHFCISIWSNPDKNSALGKNLLEKNLYIPSTKWLDYFNPETRKEYWNILKKNMFDHGVDSWWMDAVEPENDALKETRTFLGKGEFYRLIYPLMVSMAVYEGQRNTTDRKRVCMLTRSAYLGQQRYGVINWSGDVNGDWDAFRRQIVAGLNYTITGMPYWTTDIGGFFRPGKSQYIDGNYHELFIRWFQWGTFNPIFRVHGYMSETEPWKYGQKVENIIRKYLDLRYQLLPYIYSEAWQVTNYGRIIMRPLIMDFNYDENALNQPYEYMFGHSLLVAPVVDSGVIKQKIYLPAGTDWYDFWTEDKYTGGNEISKETPLDIIPIYVKAGSILPIGPKVQYTTEKKWDTLEIRIYEGADGKFTLYEDEGDNYNYEKGYYSSIDFSWNDAKKILTINNRKGRYDGMLNERVFQIKLISGGKNLITSDSKKNEKIINFKGKRMLINLN